MEVLDKKINSEEHRKFREEVKDRWAKLGITEYISRESIERIADLYHIQAEMFLKENANNETTESNNDSISDSDA